MQDYLYIVVLAALFTMAPAGKAAAQTEADSASAKKTASPVIWTYKIIDAPNSTFGYDIYANDQLFIHQPQIPARLGAGGFKTREDAEKVAQAAMTKIKNGMVPPAFTAEELKILLEDK